MKTKKVEERKRLVKRAAILVLILIIIDFPFYLHFGETHTGNISVGWIFYILFSVLLFLSLLALAIIGTYELFSPGIKKSKENSG